MTAPDRFRLSVDQRRAWHFGRGNAACAAQLGMRVGHAVDSAYLERAVEALATREELLRTRFVMPEGFSTPVAEVTSLARPHLICEALSGSVSPEAGYERERIAATDPSSESPIRLRWIASERLLIVTAAAWCADLRTLALVAAALLRPHVSQDQSGSQPMRYRDVVRWREAIPPVDRRPDATPMGCLPFALAEPRSHHVARTPVIARADGAALAARAADAGACLEDLFAALWQVMIWRFSGQECFRLSRIDEGRRHPGLERVLGVLTSAVSVRAELDPSTTLASLVERVATQRELSPAVVATRAEETVPPLAYEHFEWCGERDSDVALVHWWSGAEPFEIKLHTVRIGATVEAALAYDTSRYTASAAALFAAPLASVIEAAARQWDRPIGTCDWSPVNPVGPLPSRHAVDAPRSFVHERIERWAAAWPDRDAVVAGADRLSYGELSRRSTEVAARLRAHVKPESVVPVLADRSVHALVAILGVLKAGAAYAPFDPGRTQPWLERSRLDGPLVTTRALSRAVSSLAAICVDELSDDASCTEWTKPSVFDENLAYVLFTSGSTGDPKGVGVEHRQFARYVDEICALLKLEPGWTCAMTTSFATDLAHTAVFPTLCSGGVVHIVPDALLTDAPGFAEYLRANDIDGLKTTPSHWHALAASMSDFPLPRRHLVLGGELCTWEHVERAVASGGCRVFNHYGPTETTVVVSSHEADRDAARYAGALPVGRPLSYVHAVVADHEMRPLPVGMPGELLISGPSVARGYLGLPDRTAERFIPDPFGPHGARMYRTGDIARWQPQGDLECLGRRDGQVKVRGFRVELGEVETVLRAHPVIQQAAVVAVPSASGPETFLRACLVTVNGNRPDESELRRWLASRVPPHAVPTTFECYTELPLLPSRKIDRRALAAPVPIVRGGAECAAPAGTVEAALAALWADVLGAPISRESDFFKLGGQSLLAMRLLARVGAVFGRTVSPRALFEAPTLASFADVVGRDLAASQAAQQFLESRAVGSSAEQPLERV